MRSNAHLNGHPIHPMLIPFPFAYLFGAACVDTAAHVADRPRWHTTARHMRTMGIASALVAAVPGAVDYFLAVPPKSSASNRATLHALANLSAVGLFATVATRRRTDERLRPWELAIQAVAAGLMSAGGWMGGTLVYRNQIAVDHRYAEAGKWQERALPAPDSAETSVDVGVADGLDIDQMALLRIGSRRLVLARTERGYVAFEDRCTHKGGPLSDGTLACGTVQCPWHGSQFDVHTGQVQHGPAEASIRTYPVTERDGRLYLQLGS
jgi:nitrite reductase/ring-hydroxylating ferredoxin subunit/uncharacterized membrane protein